MKSNHDKPFNKDLQVGIQPNNTRLDTQTHQAVVKILNVALADEVVLSMKTRSAFWNVPGAGFSDRRTLFDLQYSQLSYISDEIAKRVRELGGLPMGTFQEFLENTRLVERPGAAPDLMSLIADHTACVRFMHEDARTCFEVDWDDSTYALFVRFLHMHEMMAWNLRSTIEPEMTRRIK